MGCLELVKAIGPALHDVAIAAAALVGAAVAVSGLNTWKRQLKGTAEFEAARRLMKGALRVRSKLQAVRSPFHPVEQGEHGAFEGMKKAFEQRIQAVSEAWVELDTDLLDAEGLWGDSATLVVPRDAPKQRARERWR